MSQHADKKRIILLASNLSYRAGAFVDAAARLNVEVVRGLDMPKPLAAQWRPTLPLDFKDSERATAALVSYARQHPVAAIICADDAASVIAARACAALGLPHNAPDAAYAARDKHLMRQRLGRAGVASPAFRLCDADADPARIASEITFPCVVKPTLLSGSA